jgi:hypothetical protein
VSVLRRFVFGALADNRRSGALASRMRHRRFALFRRLLATLEPPFEILDIGGTPLFWEKMGHRAGFEGVRIVLINTREPQRRLPGLESVVGDARDMSRYADGSFDVVFSNSVIEHVGSLEDQRRMAEEVRRVGKRYFLQTPNRRFPIEPHFFFPFFQYLPLPLRVALVRRANLGWHKKVANKTEARKLATSIRLLTEREVRGLFPGATLYKERFLGLTKSFVVYDGWSQGRGVYGGGPAPSERGIDL